KRRRSTIRTFSRCGSSAHPPASRPPPMPAHERRRKRKAAAPAPGRMAPSPAAPGPSAPSPAAVRGLDLLNLWVANIQTGFGPFVAVYLTTRGWTETAIGFALSLGTLTAMASQLPAGALVDAVRSKATVGFFSIAAFRLS